MAKQSIVPIEAVHGRIMVIRGQKVLHDADFEFTLLKSQISASSHEAPAQSRNLKSQNAIASSWGGRRTPPYAFTEQGVAMLSGVLRSPRAVAVNVAIMRAFVQLRQIVSNNADLARRLDELEAMVHGHDEQFHVVFETFRQLLDPPIKKRHPIGFIAPDEE